MSHSVSGPARGSFRAARSRSVARRVTAVGIAMVALVLLALSLAVAAITTQSTRTQLVASVTHATEGLVASVDTVDRANRDMVLRASKAFGRYFTGAMELDATVGTLSAGGVTLNDDFDLVDRFSADTGGVATVFARKGEDFVRVATSLRNPQGERVMYTALDHAHPAYALVRTGQSYTGRATLFGKPYMTHYEPVRDQGGAVVGILFVGTDLSAFQEGLRRQVESMRLFAHGGAMVIDATRGLDQAVFVAHATEAGKPVLQALPQARAALQALQGSSDGFARLDAALLPQQGAEPWAVLRKTQAGWWVVSEVSDQEALAGQRRALWMVWASMALALAVLAAGLFWTLRRGVSQPLRELTQAITLVARGDLTQAFHSPRRDEIGDLVHEVEDMRQRYVDMLRQQPDRPGQCRPGRAHRNHGHQPGPLGQPHRGGDPGHAPVGRCSPAGTPALGLGGRCGPARRSGGGAGGVHHGRDQRQQPPDCRHHRRDRRHRFPDQHPGAECRRRSRARR